VGIVLIGEVAAKVDFWALMALEIIRSEARVFLMRRRESGISLVCHP